MYDAWRMSWFRILLDRILKMLKVNTLTTTPLSLGLRSRGICIILPDSLDPVEWLLITHENILYYNTI